MALLLALTWLALLLWCGSCKDSECSAGPHVESEACLTKKAGCMWLALEEKNLCLPCEWSGIHLPCPPDGSIFGNQRVYRCRMKCNHQEVITKISACTDVSGSISKDDCFAKGSTASTKCMWTSFKTKVGHMKSMCGPCQVGGFGVVPAYAKGNAGPEEGSVVMAAASQCDDAGSEPCKANCPPFPLVPETGLADLTELGVPTDGNLPEYFPVTVPPPYGLKEYREAAAFAASAAGWPANSALPPEAPVVAFGPPPKEGPAVPPGVQVIYGPPPPGIPGIHEPGPGTAPPMLVPQAKLALPQEGVRSGREAVGEKRSLRLRARLQRDGQ